MNEIPPPPVQWATPPPKAPSRFTRKRVLIGTGIVLGLLVVYSMGSASGRKGFEEGISAGLETPTPTPFASLVPAETATPAPTPWPTETPTEKPTPEPAWEIDEVAAKYLAYMEWTIDYGEDTVDGLGKIGDALSEYDDVVGLKEARKLLTIHKDALEWLDNNPPEECWAYNHSLMTKAITHFAASTKAQVRWLDDFPFGSDKDFNTFEKEANAGSSDLSSASENIESCFE
jgi:hypothetical protein